MKTNYYTVIKKGKPRARLERLYKKDVKRNKPFIDALHLVYEGAGSMELDYLLRLDKRIRLPYNDTRRPGGLLRRVGKPLRPKKEDRSSTRYFAKSIAAKVDKSHVQAKLIASRWREPRPVLTAMVKNRYKRSNLALGDWASSTSGWQKNLQYNQPVSVVRSSIKNTPSPRAFTRFSDCTSYVSQLQRISWGDSRVHAFPRFGKTRVVDYYPLRVFARGAMRKHRKEYTERSVHLGFNAPLAILREMNRSYRRQYILTNKETLMRAMPESSRWVKEWNHPFTQQMVDFGKGSGSKQDNIKIWRGRKMTKWAYSFGHHNAVTGALFQFQNYTGKLTDLRQIWAARSVYPDRFIQGTHQVGNTKNTAGEWTVYFDGINLASQNHISPWGSLPVPGHGRVHNPFTFGVHGTKPRFVDMVGPASRFKLKTPWKMSPWETPNKRDHDGPVLWPNARTGAWRYTVFSARKDDIPVDPKSLYSSRLSLLSRIDLLDSNASAYTILQQAISYSKSGVPVPYVHDNHSYYPVKFRWMMPYSSEWYHSTRGQHRPYTKELSLTQRWSVAYSAAVKERGITQATRVRNWTNYLSNATLTESPSFVDSTPMVTSEALSHSTVFLRTPKAIRGSSSKAASRTVNANALSRLGYSLHPGYDIDPRYHRRHTLVNGDLLSKFAIWELASYVGLTGTVKGQTPFDTKKEMTTWSRHARSMRTLGGDWQGFGLIKTKSLLPQTDDLSYIMLNVLTGSRGNKAGDVDYSGEFTLDELRRPVKLHSWPGKVDPSWVLEERQARVPGFYRKAKPEVSNKRLSAEDSAKLRRYYKENYLVPDLTLVPEFYKNRKLKGYKGFSGPTRTFIAPTLENQEANDWRRFLLMAIKPLDTGLPLSPMSPSQNWVHKTEILPPSERIKHDAREEVIRSRANYHAVDSVSPYHLDSIKAWYDWKEWRHMRKSWPTTSIEKEGYYQGHLFNRTDSRDKALYAASALPWSTSRETTERYVKESRFTPRRVDFDGTLGAYTVGNHNRVSVASQIRGWLREPYPRRRKTRRKNKISFQHNKFRRVFLKKYVALLKSGGQRFSNYSYENQHVKPSKSSMGAVKRAIPVYFIRSLKKGTNLLGGTNVHTTEINSRKLRRISELPKYMNQMEDLVSMYSSAVSTRNREEVAFKEICTRRQSIQTIGSENILLKEVVRLSGKLVELKEVVRERESILLMVLYDLEEYITHFSSAMPSAISKYTGSFIDLESDMRRKVNFEAKNAIEKLVEKLPEQIWWHIFPNTQNSIKKQLSTIAIKDHLPLGIKNKPYSGLMGHHGFAPEAQQSYYEQKGYTFRTSKLGYLRYRSSVSFLKKPKKQRKRRRSISHFTSRNVWLPSTRSSHASVAYRRHNNQRLRALYKETPFPPR